jgi:hypothetical protein
MFGGIMLEKKARTRGLKPNKDFSLLFRSGVIITVPQSKITKRLPVERMAKDFLCFLGQEGKVEPPAEHLGVTLDINKLLVEPTLDLLRQPMEGALLPGIEREGMVTDDAAKPASPHLVERSTTNAQNLAGPFFRDPVIVERFQDPQDELLRKTFMKLIGHGGTTSSEVFYHELCLSPLSPFCLLLVYLCSSPTVYF